MSLVERKQILLNQLVTMNESCIDDSSNFKFMNLLRSRLCEEGIPIDIASQIVASLDYDFSAVDEEDDYIGQIALLYAEFVAREYTRLKDTGWHRHLSDVIIKRYLTYKEVKL